MYIYICIKRCITYCFFIYFFTFSVIFSDFCYICVGLVTNLKMPNFAAPSLGAAAHHNAPITRHKKGTTRE